MQEIKCNDDNKTLAYKDGDDLVLQCRRCSQNKGVTTLKRIPLKKLINNDKPIIKI